MAALPSATLQKRKRQDGAEPTASAGVIAVGSNVDISEKQSFMAIQAMLRVSVCRLVPLTVRRSYVLCQIASICWIRQAHMRYKYGVLYCTDRFIETCSQGIAL